MAYKSTLLVSAALVAVLAGTAAFAQGEIATWPTASFDTDRVEVERFAGTLQIVADATDGMTVDAFGPEDKMARLQIEANGDTLEIEFNHSQFRWNDWSTWLGWWHNNNFEVEDYPTVVVHLPVGSEIEIERFTGAVDIGDTYGPISVSAAGVLDGTIGNVSMADVDVAGAADLNMGDVEGALDILIAGAADISVGNVGDADIAIRGAGDVTLVSVSGQLDVSTAGAGDVTVAQINGPVDISLAGAGNVRIEGGRAEEFDVSIAGMGDVWFGGTAVNPDVSIAGMGNVFIESYEGRLSHSGMGDIDIGSGS